MALKKYVVTAGSVGKAYSGYNKKVAESVYREHCKFARSPNSRCSGEQVCLIIEGEVKRVYTPSVDVRLVLGNLRYSPELANSPELLRRLFLDLLAHKAGEDLTFEMGEPY